MVEASDLSAHPGLALERVLERPCKKDRDIVLLTHPRNLCEEDVRAAAKRLQPGARLFALTLDRHGQAELSEFKHGTPVALRQFRVDYSTAPAEPARVPPLDTGKWTGDVEPIGFPFRFGVGGKIGDTSFDFNIPPLTKYVAIRGWANGRWRKRERWSSRTAIGYARCSPRCAICLPGCSTPAAGNCASSACRACCPTDRLL
jgi:hypothetical protein